MSTGTWWGKSEPDLRSLYEWIDLHQQQQGGARGGILGAVLGGSWGLLGGSIGVLAGGLGIHPAYSVTIPVVIGCVITGGALTWFFRGRTEDEKNASRVVAEMRGFYWKLLSARWQGNIKALLGEPASLALNAGAYEFLRCRSALRSAGWQAVDSGSSWAQARNKTETAMTVAMARLVTLIGQGAAADGPEVQGLIQDMREASEQATETANRLASHRGIAGDAANELRKALGEMRALNEADDEFIKMTRDLEV